jgi:hypothetical protein
MRGIDGISGAAANISVSLVSISKPARTIADPVSRAGWQPPAIAGQTPLPEDRHKRSSGLPGATKGQTSPRRLP